MTRAYLCAIFIAAIHKFSWRRPWTILRPAWSVFWALIPFKQAPMELQKRRLDCCKNCCYWVTLTQTCGSPLSEFPQEGCHCFMSQKVKLPEAKCWSDEEFGEAAHSGSWKKRGIEDYVNDKH